MNSFTNNLGSELSQVVVTLAAGSDKADVSKLLVRGFLRFRVQGDRHVSSESRRLIELLRQTQVEFGVKAEVILQLDGRQLPTPREIGCVALYLYPSALPQDIKQQILIAQNAEVEYVCLRSTTDKEVVRTLKSCLTACGASAKVLVLLEPKSELENIASLLRASDGALLAAEDFVAENDINQTVASQRAIVKLCRLNETPVYVCLQNIE